MLHSASDSIHKGAYVQSTDPGAVGAKVLWIDTTADPPTLKYRNATNDGWETAIAPGGTAVQTGTGSPEGAVTASVGGLYVETDASPASDGLWYKQTGAGNTGWVQITASTGSGAATFSGAKLRKSTNTSIADNTTTTLTFDTEVYDTDGYHEGVTNPDRLTVPADGYYRITAMVEFVANGTGNDRALFITRNGTTTVEGKTSLRPSSAAMLPAVSVTVHATAGDYFLMRVYQDSGGALNVTAVDPRSPLFEIEKVG